MKKLIAALAVLLSVGASGVKAQMVTSFDDIEYWIGSGTNRSVLVLQWNDGGSPISYAWGYRWNGSATGLDMLAAIVGTTVLRMPFGGETIETLTGADQFLSLTLERYSFGDAVYSIVYNPPGGSVRTAADWDSGYWEYSLYAGNFDYYLWDGSGPFTYNQPGTTSYSSVVWWPSEVGASDRPLVDGSWDAWSFAPDLNSVEISEPVAAIPEPSTWALLVLTALGFGIWRFRRATRRV